MQLNHDSPASIRNFLNSRKIAPRKRWGQNFLINRGAREKIIRLLNICDHAEIWEIGPGLGAMSELILKQASSLTMFEIDPAYCLWLQESISSKRVKIIQGDVMRNWFTQWEQKIPNRILGNLPYNAASAIIASFIEKDRIAQRCVFTVQNEMGERMKAVPNTKAYSSFSILCQTSCRITDGGRLHPGSFYPSPRVHSRIIALEPAKIYGKILSPKIFHLLIRTLFTSRRKTLANNLNALQNNEYITNVTLLKDVFTDLGINLDRRPETIEPGIWVAVANVLYNSLPS